MTCPNCHTAKSYGFKRPTVISTAERASKDEPVFKEVYRIVKRPLGVGVWRCLFCHYEKAA